MAIKFFKSLFSLDPSPIPLAGVVESVFGIIEDLKKRLRSPSMLQSAVLEMLNQFSVFVHQRHGKDVWEQMQVRYRQTMVGITNSMLQKWY